MHNLFDLSGKTILVTGASSGIGREIAISASEYGAEVIITGRNEARLAETQQATNKITTILPADLTNESNITALVKQLPDLDGVVFCAGVGDYTPLKFINYGKIRSIFSLNFDSQVILTQQLVKNKKIKKGGSLVYISSISSKIGVPATGMYAASKAAINSFVKVTASEVSGLKIRANSICPGLIKTQMLENARDIVSAETISDSEKEYLLGLGSPVDVAGPALFLLSNASKWITGTELIVDGGLTVR